MHLVILPRQLAKKFLSILLPLEDKAKKISEPSLLQIYLKLFPQLFILLRQNSPVKTIVYLSRKGKP